MSWRERVVVLAVFFATLALLIYVTRAHADCPWSYRVEAGVCFDPSTGEVHGD